ncbi:hypothetical protein Tco_0822227 [Tanacetum coccineum]|uniref:Uncharacterized protein n=1 Tax=Tanacetum coccineum TaxID=301880 RepID=A0ABQ5AFE7_9ASTR
MCRRRGLIRTHLQSTFVTNEFFMGKIREVLDHCNTVVPELTFAKINEMLKEEISRLVNLANTTLNLYPTTSSSKATTSTVDMQHQLYLTMKSNLQDQAADPEHHDDHHYDAALLEGEKWGERAYILPFLEEDLEEKLKRWVRKEFKTFNEEARLSIQHWKDRWHKRMYKINQRRFRDNLEDYFSNHRITEVVKINSDQQHGLDYMEQIIMMRENNKPDSFSEADFKYINKNDIEDFYQIRVNLTAPTLTFPGIEAHDPYYIVDKPSTGLIYLNRKEKKRVIYLAEIVKFWDATLERVLNEVKLKIFKFEPWKKPPLLGELNLDILKACEREITKRLRHRVQMRKWESDTIQKHLFEGTGLFKINKICHGVSSERK